MLARIVAMLTRLIDRFDRDEPPILRRGLTFPIVLVVVLDVFRAPPPPSFSCSFSIPYCHQPRSADLSDSRPLPSRRHPLKRRARLSCPLQSCSSSLDISKSTRRCLRSRLFSHSDPLFTYASIVLVLVLVVVLVLDPLPPPAGRRFRLRLASRSELRLSIARSD